MYKLHDFNVRGLGEPIRLMFKYSRVEFDDIRYPCTSIDSKLPPEIKEKCPWGDVPMLEICQDGKETRKLAQSLAIGRYIANKCGLRGSNEFESAVCDEYVDACADLFEALFELYTETEPEKLKLIEEKVLETVRGKYLSKFENILQENKRQNGVCCLVGGKFSWADIYLVHRIDDAKISHGLDFTRDKHGEKYLELVALYESFYAIPRIQEWVKHRPVTKF